MKNYQNILFPYAYNILGSIDDSKDVIQDVLVQYHSTEKKDLDNETGYLVKSVINRSINLKKRNRKITTQKIWLPEPIATEKADSNIHKDEIISYSLLVLLEKLTAKERGVFILKEAFDYSHKEIAETLQVSIENSRKLVSRAKSKLRTFNQKFDKNIPLPSSTYLQNYIQSIKNGDVEQLEHILSTDISLHADGGENIKVVRELTIGKKATISLLQYVYKTYLISLDIKTTQINHQPALLFYRGETLINCQVFEVEKGIVQNIFSIIDPDKLKQLFI